MKVLLADDDKEQLDLRSLLLAKKGFKTIPVTTAAAALREQKAHHPECAVIDLKMPTEAIGLELIRSLKDFDAEIRVFLLTGVDPRRISALPEKTLLEEVIVKGSPTSYLLKKLAEIAKHHDSPLVALRASLTKDRVVTFAVKAVPRAARSEVIGTTTDGAIKVRVAAVPDKGKANDELRDVLAAWFRVPKSNVALLQGQTSSRKVWRVRK